MAYSIRAIVAAPPVAGRVAQRLHAPTTRLTTRLTTSPAFDPVLDMVLLPLPGEESEELLEDMEALFLDARTERWLAEVSLAGPVAYIEAEYFGIGYQASMGWRGGARVVGPSYTSQGFTPGGIEPINDVLHLLGVVDAAGRDAFDTVDLGRHRSPDEWPRTPPHPPTSTACGRADFDRGAAVEVAVIPDTAISPVGGTAADAADDTVDAAGGADSDAAQPESLVRPVGDPENGGEVSGPAALGPPRRSAPVRIVVLGPARIYWCPPPLRPAAAAGAPTTGTTGTTGDTIRPDGAAPAGPGREVTARFQPRTRELLVLLAVHPDGVTRDDLIAALWLCRPSAQATNALNTAFSRLRRAVHTATDGALRQIVAANDGRYRLDPDLVETDYRRFAAAIAARRAARSDTARRAAHQEIIEACTGVLADGLGSDWIDVFRETVRREVVEAVAALARSLVDADPEQTLDLLEVARSYDPHNEALYRDIMRLQARLGHLDAIERTLRLLSARLAELGDQPAPETITLALRLRRRSDPVSVGDPV